MDAVPGRVDKDGRGADCGARETGDDCCSLAMGGVFDCARPA